MDWDLIGKTVHFLPGDIVCTQDKMSMLSWWIRFFQRRKGEDPSIFNHVGIMVNETRLAEALKRVLVNPITKYKSPFQEIMVARRKNLSKEQQDTLVNKAFDYVGRDYGYLKIAAHVFDYGLSRLCERDIYFFRRIFRMDKYPICSWVVAYCYDKIGVSFGVPLEACQPDDIGDSVFAKRNEYDVIFVTDGIEKEVTSRVARARIH